VSRRGETLVEVVVSLLLLTVGALALAAGIGEAQRARRLAASAGLALAAAEGWLEEWRPGPLRGDASGRSTIGWGVWEGDLEWETAELPGCLEAARVRVASARGEPAAATLASRRFAAGGACS
jgi:hypothetical protein